MLREAVLQMARYHAWANEVFAEYFMHQDPELVTRHFPSSFPSIRQTMLHIWDGLDVWYRRLHGESPTVFRSEQWSGSLDATFRGLIDISQRFVEYVTTLSEADLEEVVEYKTMAGRPQSSKRYEVLLHVFNHSTYHRGQCVTMARALDLLEIPSTDFVRFLRLS
jgi:uncharacterized damage-inducible protein DinB